jgi:plastocyanin
MSGIAFRAPLGGDDITIKLGDTVEWVNRDGVSHTATSNSTPGGGSSFDSGLMGNSDSFSFTPSVTGTWVYFCAVHPAQMQDARITVIQ